jgi:hypothetical protein
VPVTNPASTFEAFSQAESDQMESVFQELSPEAQATCLALNPSPEDIAFAAAEKAAREKAKEAERRRNKEVIVEVGPNKDETVAEADESDPYADGAELEDRAPESAEEIEAAEAEVGVPIGKVRPSLVVLSLALRAESHVDLPAWATLRSPGRALRGLGPRHEVAASLLASSGPKYPGPARPVVLR